MSGRCPYPLLWSRPGHTQTIEAFVSDAMEAMSTRPESIEEISEANARHCQIKAREPEV